MTPDAEAESLAAALSYLDDMPMLLESSALLLDAGGWLGGKLPPVPSNSSDSLEYDPSELLETLSTSSLLDISLAEAAGIAPPSPVRLSPRLQLQIERQPAGEAPQQRQSLAMSAPSRLVQLRQQTAADQAKATHNRMVVPAAPASRALAKKPAGKKPLNYNPNRARDERRQELIYLRQKVKEMEEQLQLVHSNQAPGGNPAAIPMRLGQKRSLAAAAEPSYDRSSIVRSACTGNIKAQKTQHSMASAGSAQFVVPKVWQDMCARQLEQRIKAERENIRLKLILEGQIKIAKSMEKLLKKRETLRVRCAERIAPFYTDYDPHQIAMNRPWKRAEVSAPSAFIYHPRTPKRTPQSTTCCLQASKLRTKRSTRYSRPTASTTWRRPIAMLRFATV